MWKLLGLLALLLLGAGAWFLGNALSSDAIGLALGVIFGTMASLPGALLVLVAARRQQAQHDPYYTPRPAPPPPVHQPPAQLPGPVTLVFEDQAGRRATMQFADPDAARRFLAEGRR